MDEADAQRVRQIVVNLLDNAVKFTAEGSVTVDVASVVIESGVPTNGAYSRRKWM
ncbi:MAG: hypothetical protein R3E39_12780 [Anaerolineae bacterium]